MRPALRIAVLTAGLGAVLGAGRPARAEEPPTPAPATAPGRGEARLQDYNACGVSALYLIARMRGSDATYQEVAQAVGATEGGYCTMADLVRAGRALGFYPVAIELRSEHWSLLNGRLSIARTSDGGEEPRGAHFLVFAGTRTRPDGGEWVHLINPPESPYSVPKGRYERAATDHFVVMCRTPEEEAELVARIDDLGAPAASKYAIAATGILLVLAVGAWWPLLKPRPA